MEDVKITIEGEGLSVTKHTTLQKAGQIISFLGVDHGRASDSYTGSTAPQPALIGKQIQLRDVIFNSEAKTYPEKIVAVASYLRDQLGQSTFSPQELKVLFKKLGDEPKNFTRDLNKAIADQHILCVDEEKEQYELTEKGNAAVQSNFKGSQTFKKSSTAKKSGIPRTVREEVKKLEIGGAMDGYPDYNNLSTKGDRILWLLEYAYKKDIKALTPAEVDCLSVKLRDKIDSNGFTALNARNIKSVFVIKTAEGFQIQQRGSDYIKKVGQPKG